ncbi:MAG: EAL domain-containing protein [Lachnospiraceae bacterium]|nr:EAL domain-containing protein [Lachnospiraceae bacterium]
MNSKKAGILIYSKKRLEIESLKIYLELNYNVFLVENTKEVMNVLEAQDIDFLLMDISDETDDLLNFITGLKYSDEYHNLIICILHNDLSEELTLDAMQKGVSYCFDYPANPSLIDLTIKNLVISYVDDNKRRNEYYELQTFRMESILEVLNAGFIDLAQKEKYYIEFMGNKAATLLGVEPDEIEKSYLGYAFDDLIYHTDLGKFYSLVSNIFESGDARKEDIRIRKKNGNYYKFELIIKNVRYNRGTKILSVIIRQIEAGINDIDRELNVRGEHDSSKFDMLTEIYNKETFFVETAKMLDNNPNKEYILSIWDIDRFKAINEMLGSKKGDKLLVDFANFLKLNLDSDRCTYGRIESDHFVTCCSARFHEKADKNIRDVLSSHILWHTLDNTIFMHVGMYRMDASERDIAIACDRATMALHAIKDSYVYRMNFFSNEMRDALVTEQEIVKDSEQALENGDFFVMYQPIIDSRTKEIVSAEALVRWKKQDGTHIPPGVFIPTFEKNGFVTKIDQYVLNEVCTFQKNRINSGQRIVPISVNLSRMDFYDIDIYEKLMAMIDGYGLDNRAIKFEVTESAYMDQPQELMRVMDKLRKSGYQILMDDFGSGFSSLNMLKDFPVDVLKIDMKFMDSIDISERASNILYNIIRMAKSINMQIVAEGVETGNQYELLKSMNCDCIQGYYFYRPLMADDFSGRLSEHISLPQSKTEKMLYNILLLSEDEKKKNEIEEVFDQSVEVFRVDTCEDAEEYLKKTFANVNVIMVDIDSLREESLEFVNVMLLKPFYNDIPLLAFINRGQMDGFVDDYIRDETITDIIPVPYSRQLLRQRIRRTIDYYSVESERRAISILRRSVLLRQQVNSFFEDSEAGIARIILDRSEGLPVKEVSYINNGFLNLHMITLDEAMKADRLGELMPHVLFSELDSIDKSIRYAVNNNEAGFTKEQTIETNEGYTKSIIVSCSIKYKGDELQLDLVLIENTEATKHKTGEFIDALYSYLGRRNLIGLSRYYFKHDIVDFYEDKGNGHFLKSVVYNAKENFMAVLNASNKDVLRVRLQEIDERLGSGEEVVSEDLLVKEENNGEFKEKYIRHTCYLINEDEIGSCAIAISEDVTEEYRHGYGRFRASQYTKIMNMNAEIYIEADLTSNSVINKDCIEPLMPYGIGRDASYDDIMVAFKSTVEKEDYDKVIGTVNRKELIRQYRQGNTYICFDYMASTLKDPSWMWYQITIILGENSLNGNIIAGIKLEKTRRTNTEGITEKDSLTDLYSRVMFERKINRIIEDRGNDDKYLVAIIDVDNFKRINDCFGHNIGDSILKTISRVLIADLPENSVIGRLGGDEFAAFIPSLGSREETEAIFKRINDETVLEFGLGPGEDENLIITTSIGVVVSDKNDITFHKLYPKADIALNQAKESGKNTYKFFMDIF